MHLPRITSLRLKLDRGLICGPAPDLRKSAVIVAPHQDDEVLGCGGTIARKIEEGATVHLVFMTDGATSHRRFIPPAELVRVRRGEAIEAARILGVPESQVTFLDYPDGRLHSAREAAVSRIAALLATLHPEEVFVPYRFDGTPDHESTYVIVTDALRGVNAPTQVFEYPVWFWNQWPWVSLPLPPNRQLLHALRRSLRFGFGRTARRTFTHGVDVRSVAEKKRQALAAHRSQVTRLNGDPAWPILDDVSGGQFVACMTGDYEVFAVGPGIPLFGIPSPKDDGTQTLI